MKELDIVVDLQFGSTGKGLLAGFLAEKNQYDTIVTAWSPNAGHTYINADGVKFVNTAIPNGIVSNGLKHVLIGPGSIINPDTFLAETEAYSLYLDGIDVLIHENAAVVTQAHRDEEAASMFAIGSTMKGCGAAIVDKIRRNPKHSTIARDALIGTPLEGFVVTAQEYNRVLDRADRVLLEGAQGFSLSINQGFYPFTTSRDCTTHQLLSDCAIPRTWHQNMTVYGCARTYPIRVANRFDTDGRMVGTSGPCYDDQEEIKWSRLGMEPELTTVTQLPRRIFTFSRQQIREAIRMDGVDEVFLNFANYVPLDKTPGHMELGDMISTIEDAGAAVSYLGFGPSVLDIVDRGEE
jgi:adenylosuccinate synthase